MPPGAGRPLDRAFGVCFSNETGRGRLAARNRIVAFDTRATSVTVHRPESASHGPMLAQVTNAIVRLHRQHYGKGPTRSKSYLMDDVLICVMQDVLTVGERTLAEAGNHDHVRTTRLAYADALRDRFAEEVERIVGRRVLGFTSQILVTRDVAIEMFALEPFSRPPEA
jgi:uncharacterized protein YbcI